MLIPVEEYGVAFDVSKVAGLSWLSIWDMMEDDQHRATKMELLPNKYNINMTVVYTDHSLQQEVYQGIQR